MNLAKLNPAAVAILLVEDNPQDAEMALRSFRRHHLANHVAWVKDGAEALAFFFGASGEEKVSAPMLPRLILLDIKLPKLDGFEVLQRLKADPQTRRIPVVVLTSSREEKDIERCYAAGANSYIVKPVDFDNFSQAVEKLGLYWLLLNLLPEGAANA